MTEEFELTEQEGKKEGKSQVNVNAVSSDAVYGIGMIGAWVYYIGLGETPRDKILGFFKGFAWPAFLVYDLLVFLNKE